MAEVDFEKWEKSRTLMFLNFCVVAFTFGLSMTAYYPTEYYYLNDFMKLKDAKIFYGLSWAFLCGSGVASSLIGSYYADATKDIRTIFLVTNFLSIVGSIMYALYYSPYLVLSGQLLIGTAAARMVAGVGEISRVYDAEDITHKISFMGVFSVIGAVIGPCTSFAFQFVDTNLGDWKLNIGNMVGITMALLYTLQIIFTFFTLQNVSKTHTKKDSQIEERLLSEEYENRNMYSDNEGFDKELSFQEKYILALKMLFQSKHIIFLFAVSFYATYVRSTITLLQPIVTTEYLHWEQIDLATFMILTTCGGAIPMALLLAAISKHVDDFYLFLFTMFSLMISLMLTGILPYVANHHTPAVVIVYTSGLGASIASAGSQILLRSMLAKLVPENVQTATEAIRNCLFESSFMLTGLLVKIPSAYLTTCMLSFAMVLSLFLSWFLLEEKTFRNMKPVAIKR